jgi:hypothetical protein
MQIIGSMMVFLIYIHVYTVHVFAKTIMVFILLKFIGIQDKFRFFKFHKFTKTCKKNCCMKNMYFKLKQNFSTYPEAFKGGLYTCTQYIAFITGHTPEIFPINYCFLKINLVHASNFFKPTTLYKI